MAENLVLRLIARTGAFERSMKRSRQHVNLLGGSFRQLALRASAFIGPAVLGYYIRQTLQSVDANAKLSDRIGITTEKLAGLQHGAQISGVEQGTLNKSLEIFSRRLGEVDLGVGQAKYALDKLGLSADELANKTPDEAIGIVADQINRLGTQAEKAAAANYLFGRSGQSLLNLFSQGSEGIAAFQREAEKLGLTYSRLDAAKIEAANDAMTRLKGAGRGLITQTTIELAPAIEAVATALTESMIASDGFGKSLINAAEAGFRSVKKLGEAVDKVLSAPDRFKATLKSAELNLMRLSFENDLKVAERRSRDRWTEGGRTEARRDVQRIKRELDRIDQLMSDQAKILYPSPNDDGLDAFFNNVRTNFEKNRASIEERMGAPAGGILGTDGTSAVQAAKAAGLDIATAMNRMYGQINRMTAESYQYRLSLINQERDTYQQAGIDRLAVDQWYNDQFQQLQIERLQASDRLQDGFKAARMQAEIETRTMGQRASDIYGDIYQANYSALQSMERDWDHWSDHAKNAMAEVLMSVNRNLFYDPLARGLTNVITGGASAILNGLGGGLKIQQVGAPMSNPTMGPLADDGMVTRGRSVVTTGNITEAHIPMPSGKVPVDLRGGGGNMNVFFEFHNNGTPKTVDVQKQKIDMETMMVRVMLDDARGDGPITKELRQVI